MRINEVRHMSVLDRFMYFIEERWYIYTRKTAGDPKPWTDDEILQNYRFCNVRRMDDKVSDWLYRKWYKPHYGHQNMVYACTIARHFNLPSTLEVIGFPTDASCEHLLKDYLPMVRTALRAIRSKGDNIFNAAYVISGGTGGGKRDWVTSRDKIDIVLDCVFKPMIEKPPKLNTDSMQKCVELLQTYPGIGSFMAGQIVADLRWAIPGKWSDKDTWAAQGPGSTRGILRLHLKEPKKDLSNMTFLKWLNEVIDHCKECKEQLSPDLTSKLEAHDYQNCLCEFDKYERALWGQGKPKQKYPGLRETEPVDEGLL